MGNFFKGNMLFLGIVLGLLTLQNFIFKNVNGYVLVFINIGFYIQVLFLVWTFSKSRYIESFTKEKWLAFVACYLNIALFNLNNFLSFWSYGGKQVINLLLAIFFNIYIISRLRKILKHLKEFKYYSCVLNDSILIFIPFLIVLIGFVPSYMGKYHSGDIGSSILKNINMNLANLMMLFMVFIIIISLVTSFYSKAQVRVNLYLTIYTVLKLIVYYLLYLNPKFESNYIYTLINFLDACFYTGLMTLAKGERKTFSKNMNHIQGSDYDDIINAIIFGNYILFSFLSIFIFDILNTKGNIIRYAILNIFVIHMFLVRVIMNNKTKKKNIEEILAREKLNKVSNIYSRFEFKEKVESFLGKYTLFIVDIKNFKWINEVYGREIGDQLLFEFGKRLSDISERSKIKIIYGSYGGDEFLIGLKSIKKDDINLVISEVNKIGNIYMTNLSKSLKIKVNIGYSLNNSKKNFDTTFHEATFAKKMVKKEILLNSIEYSDDINKLRMKSKIIKKGIISALNNKDLYTVYQPQISSKTNRIIGYETLIRWNHEILGNISADYIITTLEELELINELDLYVFEEACNFQRTLIEHDINIQCSINISINTLKDRDIVYKLDKISKKYKLNPKHITIEILEDFDLEANGIASNQIIKLKKYGFKISVDDFGKGYSSINRLLKIPFDQIKIPREFIDDIANEKYISMISSIATFAKGLGAELVVEGIESKEHCDFFTLLDFDIIQGFYFSEGLRETDFIDYAINLGIGVQI